MSGLACDPFGEQPAPWWRSLLRSEKQRIPKRYTVAAGTPGALAGLSLDRGSGVDGLTRFAIFAALTLLPPFLLQHWWRRRERRQEERLIVLPSHSSADVNVPRNFS